jgi:multidrug resistance protein MdtO
MATLAQSVPASPQPLASFWEFLKEEVQPYPGRSTLAARMVIAGTLAMIITMTFRIPYGAYCAIYAFTISRDSSQITVRTARTRIISYACGAAYVLIGALFFLDDPVLRFVWVIGALFIMFYAISAMANYAAASTIGYLIVLTVPLWDEHISAEARVEGTLWAIGALTIGSVVAVVVELVFAEIRPGDDLLRSIADRLASVEALLASYLTERTSQAAEDRVTRLALLGASRLRSTLRGSSYPRDYTEQMGAVVALVGRLVDIAANLTHLNVQASPDDRQRIRTLVANIAGIRADLLNQTIPSLAELTSESEALGSVPLLREMEKTVSLIPEVFSGKSSMSELALSPSDGERPWRLFVPDALSNSEHLKWGLKGGLAASLCYVVYTSIAWPGISTAVTTCLLTALTTVGFSRQKQILRFAGAVVGGFVFGMGSQVFILPYLDSIAGFTVLFIAVSALAAWFTTASPRLSYFGVQIVVAFYLINLQEFRIQTSLAVARDRVVGILLGLFVMWLVFDQLWGTLAGVEMKKTYISNLRCLAQLARQPFPEEKRLAVEHSFSLRETINANFDNVRSLADGVLFEFGSPRQQDLALRSQIRQWQPRLRTLFVTRIALVKYRLRLPGFELPEAVAKAQQEFDDRLAGALDRMANRMEGKALEGGDGFENAFERLEVEVRSCVSEGPQPSMRQKLQTFLALSRNIDSLTTSLEEEI